MKTKFEKFVAHCESWKKKLGITGMDIAYEPECDEGAYATSHYDRETTQAEIALCKDIGDEIDLKRLALHECLHLLLWEMTEELEPDKRIVLEHKIINKIISLLMDTRKSIKKIL